MKRFKMIKMIIVIAILSAMIFMTFTDRPMDKDSLIVVYISFLILSFQELLSIEDSKQELALIKNDKLKTYFML